MHGGQYACSRADAAAQITIRMTLDVWVRGKDQKRSALRDERAGTYDRAATKRDAGNPNVVPGDDIPEGLRRKPKGAPNKGFRRGEPAKHVPQNE
jgi:hypothetical protein